MIQIIVLSNIRIYREGLTQVLTDTHSFHVVGAESHFDGAIHRVKQHSPDVVLLDMTLPGSCQIARHITQFFPATKIVALAAPEDENHVISCAEAGISSYVAREASLDELIEVIKKTQKGEVCCPPNIATYIFRRLQKIASQPLQVEPPLIKKSDTNAVPLTGREKQIAKLISNGLSNKQISRELSIEVSTVKTHVHNILVKLDVKNRVQVISLVK